jgi:hypothetical protein
VDDEAAGGGGLRIDAVDVIGDAQAIVVHDAGVVPNLDPLVMIASGVLCLAGLLPDRSFDAVQDSRLFGSLEFTAQSPTAAWCVTRRSLS